MIKNKRLNIKFIFKTYLKIQKTCKKIFQILKTSIFPIKYYIIVFKKYFLKLFLKTYIKEGFKILYIVYE